MVKYYLYVRFKGDTEFCQTGNCDGYNTIENLKNHFFGSYSRYVGNPDYEVKILKATEISETEINVG